MSDDRKKLTKEEFIKIWKERYACDDALWKDLGLDAKPCFCSFHGCPGWMMELK